MCQATEIHCSRGDDPNDANTSNARCGITVEDMITKCNNAWMTGTNCDKPSRTYPDIAPFGLRCAFCAKRERGIYQKGDAQRRVSRAEAERKGRARS